MLLVSKIFLLSFIFMVCCHADNQIPKDEVLLDQQIVNSRSEDKNTCDFSEYKPVTISHFVQFSLVTKYKALYPPEAKDRKIQGKINVKILVNADGDVVKACALDGNEILGKASEESALKWKFKKTERKSYVEAGIVFNYVLDKETSSNETTEIITP